MNPEDRRAYARRIAANAPLPSPEVARLIASHLYPDGVRAAGRLRADEACRPGDYDGTTGNGEAE